jgi:TolB-like protein/tRNA A-37 threonylcarbamoyl transferase component Bud32
VSPEQQLVECLVEAILDGKPVDWAAAESSSRTPRLLVEQLKVLAAVAELHGAIAVTPSTLEHVAPAAPGPAAGQMPAQWGHLRLLERIGGGSFGDVYRAWDTRLDREVALKLLPARPPAVETAAVLIREGKLLARVRHPNVVTIYGAEQIADRVGLWMELVRGRTLEQILEERKPLSAADTIGIGLELCQAMTAVHGAGLLHRDIKTHNVMRADDGRVVLMDFGAGRELDDDAAPDLAGTPLYLAPEVLNGQHATVQSDIYGLGVLLYHLVTGSYPVHARTVRGVRLAHERGERTAVRDARSSVPRPLARVIERATDPRPERRHPSVGALSADLEALKGRPGALRLPYVAASAAAFLLVIALGWSVVGRQAGFRTPSAPVRGVEAATGAGGGSVSLVGRPVVAVLPFTNLSAQPGAEYYVDGLTDGIIRNLAVVDGLQVRSRASSFAFKGKPRDLHQIAAQLGANLVIEGSAELDGTRLRIGARLVQAEGDVLLWAERFERELEAVFSIHDDISRAVVNRLGLRAGAARAGFVTSLDNYALYLQAHALVDRRGIPNAGRAAELFDRVIASDPGFAPAYAGLASAYAFMSFPYRGIPFEQAYPIMRPAALKARSLAPKLAEAHAAVGWVYAYEHDWVNAHQAFQQAIELDPSLIQAYTSYSISTLQPLEKYDQALRLLQVASQRDPLSLDVQREIGEVQLFAGRYADAVETFRRVSELEPDFPFVHTFLGRALTFTGRVKEALPLLEPGVPWLAPILVQTGRRAEAERLADESERYPYRLAIITAALGDTERAVDALERAAASEPHRIGRLLINPELASLREDPRVLALRKRFSLP